VGVARFLQVQEPKIPQGALHEPNEATDREKRAGAKPSRKERASETDSSDGQGDQGEFNFFSGFHAEGRIFFDCARGVKGKQPLKRSAQLQRDGAGVG
jgi:hypothetical protein